jgi:hypothetical protein
MEVHRGGRLVIWQHPGPADERLLTRRLELVPVVADDAEELIEVFGDERLYVFLGSRPTTTEELRVQFARLAADRLADTEGTVQRNWTVRRPDIHPDHHASATVATRAGLWPTGQYRDHEGVGEQLWRQRLEAPPHSAHPPVKEQHMPTADGDPVRERLADYAAALHTQGAIRSQAVQQGFASVRRDRCITSFYTSDGTVDVPRAPSRQPRSWTASTATRR